MIRKKNTALSVLSMMGCVNVVVMASSTGGNELSNTVTLKIHKPIANIIQMHNHMYPQNALISYTPP